MKRSEIPSHYEVLNGRIESARIEISEHHGMLDAWVMFDFGGFSQGFGGYALYLPPSFTHHNPKSFAGHHIFRIMQTADVTQWHELKNNAVRVVRHDGTIRGMGHIINDDWYLPEVELKEKA